jgi:hypothetical protein
MKDEERTSTIKAGKGARIECTAANLAKLVDAFNQAQGLYETAESPAKFMKLLELEEVTTTQYTRGNRDYAALNKFLVIPTGAGEEFRLTFSLNDQGQFTIDFRQWWGG